MRCPVLDVAALLVLALAPGTGGAAHVAGAGPPAWAGSRSASAVHGTLAESANGRDGAAAEAISARKSRARELWQAHRDELDLDPSGQLIVRDEIVALAQEPTALDAVLADGFVVRRRQELDGLGAALVVLAPPRAVSTPRALRRLRKAIPGLAFDYNHLYFQTASAATVASAAAGAARSGAAAGPVPPHDEPLRVGLIDGGVEAAHAALRGLDVRAHGCDGVVHPSGHGTAVASLLLPRSADEGRVASARLELFSADVYCGAPTGGAVDALAEALAWLVAQRVAVVNISLTGPSNVLLERVVRMAVERGHLLVAAVGNDGPAAPPLYPAAYPGVVAVTAVDRSGKVLMEAAHGPYVHFAAPGADVTAARVPDGETDVRGTSFAAPRVSMLLAQRLPKPDVAQAAQVLHEFEARALDLGAPGFDPVYGYGCLGCTELSPTADSRRRP